MNDANAFYLIIQTRWLDLVSLAILGAALGMARGAYGHDSASVSGQLTQRLIKYATLGFCAAFLWALALVLDVHPTLSNPMPEKTIPFGPVMNLVVLIILSVWASEILEALVTSSNRVVALVQKYLINKLPLNGINKK